ncbi:hypothetical protein FAGKG844_760002 [Frankia sp. AgKG'84/4]
MFGERNPPVEPGCVDVTNTV